MALVLWYSGDIYRRYGWGTFVCQDCHGAKKCRRSKRCMPCNYKSKEWAETRREAMKRLFEDPLERAKMSQIQKKRLEDPTERAKISSALNRPEVRETRSKAVKKFYEDPEERRKLSKAMRRSWKKRKQAWKPDQSKS